MEFDFQRYIQERKREGERERVVYAYDADLRAMRALDLAKPVALALELGARSVGAHVEALVQGEALPSDLKARVGRVLSEVCVKLKASEPAWRATAQPWRHDALALVVGQAPTLLLDDLIAREADEPSLRFVLGRACGHLQHNHAPLLGAAWVLSLREEAFLGWAAKPARVALERWARAGRVTGDRAGLLACGALDVACGALIRAERGWAHGPYENLSEVLDLAQSPAPPSGERWEALREFGAELPWRLRALAAFAGSEVFRRSQGSSGGESLAVVDSRVSDLVGS